MKLSYAVSVIELICGLNPLELPDHPFSQLLWESRNPVSLRDENSPLIKHITFLSCFSCYLFHTLISKNFLCLCSNFQHLELLSKRSFFSADYYIVAQYWSHYLLLFRRLSHDFSPNLLKNPWSLHWNYGRIMWLS